MRKTGPHSVTRDIATERYALKNIEAASGSDEAPNCSDSDISSSNITRISRNSDSINRSSTTVAAAASPASLLEAAATAGAPVVELTAQMAATVIVVGLAAVAAIASANSN